VHVFAAVPHTHRGRLSAQREARMRRTLVLLLVTIATVVTIAAPGTAATAQTTAPTITLVEYCPVLGGQQFYGAMASVSGLPPNSTFVGTLDLDGLAGSATYTTDEHGNYGPIGLATDVTVEIATFTVLWSGGELFATLERPCQTPALPTTKTQCRLGGFAAYGFKNQGACVRFLVSHIEAAEG
jgi:hypothetical protein